MAVIHFTSGERLVVVGPPQAVMNDLNAGRSKERFQGPDGTLPPGWVPFDAGVRQVYVNPAAVAYVTEQ